MRTRSNKSFCFRKRNQLWLLLSIIGIIMTACSSDSEDIDSPDPEQGSGGSRDPLFPVAEAVDLGLPSGTKWASWNIGASAPEDFGGYYAWGEKDFYNWSNYSHCDGDYSNCHYIGYDISGTEYDVAHVKWGGSWRMPTDVQIDELIDNCYLDFIDEVGKKGVLFTGPSGASIFLPAAGVREDKARNVGTHGCYSSSTSYTKDYDDGSCDLSFELKSNYCNGGAGNRDAGCTVRAVLIDESKEIKEVRLSCPNDNHPHMIDLGLPSGTKWACCNVGASKPEDFGGYYAWGVTEEKNFFNDSEFYGYTWDGYYDYSNFGDDIAGTDYDVAHVMWGESWRMPSKDQIQELMDNSTMVSAKLNSVFGNYFIGPNNSVIFLPNAGRYYNYDDSIRGIGSDGEYWSSSLLPPYNLSYCTVTPYYITFFHLRYWTWGYVFLNQIGKSSVRAVCP